LARGSLAKNQQSQTDYTGYEIPHWEWVLNNHAGR